MTTKRILVGLAVFGAVITVVGALILNYVPAIAGCTSSC
jgi:hypothetical protein